VSEPTTAAGRAMWENGQEHVLWYDGPRVLPESIAAIEAEARADALAEVAAAVEGLTDPVDAERFRAAVLALLEKAS
jgi:uncharacterized protein (DUF2267 family)